MKLRRIGLMGASLALAGGMIAVSAGAASAATPKVFAHFHSGAIDGGEVTISGRNLPPSTLVAIVECNGTVTTAGAAACNIAPGTDEGDLVIGMTSATGTLHQPFYIAANDGTVGANGGTCNTGDTCFIVVATLAQQPLGLLPFVVAPNPPWDV
jgi:hypothetical protein